MNSAYREPAAVKLLERLTNLAYSDKYGLGHQNAGHIGVSITAKDGTESDIKNLCGAHPLVVGVDTLSFFGYEGKYDDLVTVIKNLNKEGVIITLSSHMPNFSLGGDAFFDYSPMITAGDVPARIMPGGDLNSKYIRFLNKIADLCCDCIDVYGERIPMIFRPFHEDNGNWFWWGKEHLGNKEFIELFRYTVDYIRNERGIRNLLFSYSPNGKIGSVEEYMDRYPGDDYVDIMGLDYYYDKPASNKLFDQQFVTSLEFVKKCADRCGKIYALTETGVRVLDETVDGRYYEGLAPQDNPCKDWFTHLEKILDTNEATRSIAYVLFWANFSDQQFWVPYIRSDFKHEMVDDFIEFAKGKHAVLAGEE